MTLEAGDDLDCPFCDGTHEVRRSKAVRVKGFAGRVPASLYVDCPEAGFLVVDDDGGVEAVADGEQRGGGKRGEDGEREAGRERDDWP